MFLSQIARIAFKGLGQNGDFAVSKSTTSLLSDTFYRTELSLFIPKLWLYEIYRVS